MAGAGRDVHAVFCSKSSGRLALGAASGAEPESPDVFANAPKFLGRVTNKNSNLVGLFILAVGCTSLLAANGLSCAFGRRFCIRHSLKRNGRPGSLKKSPLSSCRS